MATEAKRESKVQRIFISEDGEAHARATLDTTQVVFKYADGNETRFDLSTVFPGGALPAPCVGRAAAAFGINTSAGNLAGPLSSADEIREAVEGRLEDFASGAWTTARESGNRPSDLLEAWIVFRTQNGSPVTDNWRAGASEKLKDEDFREQVIKEPQIAAALAKIKADRAAVRAAAAAQAAKGKGPSADLLG